MTFGTVILLLLSACAVVLGLMAVEPAIRIFRRWHKADEEEKYELEKDFYLTLTVVYVILGIRLFVVPLYFWTMQSLVPMIPGAMCMWGVFNASPTLAWPTLFLKFLFPVLYGGWIILAKINNTCKRNQLMRKLMGLYVFMTPLLITDGIIDLVIFLNLTPVSVACCVSAIDVGPRPVPALIMGISGQLFLLIAFFGLSGAYAITTFLCLRHEMFEWLSRIISLILVPTTVIAMTEVFAPWILRMPLHHCPFCLLQDAPASILFLALFWYALAGSWWALLTKKLGRVDEEARAVEKGVRNMLWTTSGSATLLGLTVIGVHLAVAFA